MCRYVIALSLCLGALLGCSQDKGSTSQAPAPAPAPLAAAGPITVGDFQLQPPIEIGSVQIIPISMNKPIPQQDGNFITLSEAKKAGLVEITELEGEDVNALSVENKGTRPILLLGGELLLGGKQDRIVARDVIIPPGKKMNVEVYCVEHGRWEGESEHFDYRDTVVPDRVRQAAAYDGQEAVWGEVDSYNYSNGIGGSLTVAKGMESSKVKKAVDDHTPKALKELASHKNVVGMIYVLNGKLQSADIFGNSKIFEAAKESLVKGYLAEGATESAKENSQISSRTYKRFMEEILKDREERAKGKVAGKTYEMQNQVLRGVEIKGDSSIAGEAPLHGNYAPRR